MSETERVGRGIGRRWWIALGAACVLALGVGVVTRVHAGPWRGHHLQSAAQVQGLMEGKLERLLDAVDADDAQRERVQALIESNAPHMFALAQEGRLLRQELKQALLAPQIERARIEAAKRKLDLLTERMANLGVDGLAAVAEVLTPAQRKQVADRLAHMHD